MIKALFVIHVWSLFLAGFAWVLQRDGNGKLGGNFPVPGIWLGLIYLCMVPGIFSFVPVDPPYDLPSLDVVGTSLASNAIGDLPGSASFSLLWLYFLPASAFVTQTLWRWIKLQRLPANPTDDPDVYISSQAVPPLTLSWPRRAILIPEGLDGAKGLIAHEKTHLKHFDAELTLLMLVLRDLLWRSPGISYLVRQWRLSIELRADTAAMKNCSKDERTAYAGLLLNGLHPEKFKKDDQALPCPTAHLTSTRYRSVKMRLKHILENEAHARKMRWDYGVCLATLLTVFVGAVSVSASPWEQDQDPVKFVKRVPPTFPKNCKGLDLSTVERSFTTTNLPKGGEKKRHRMIVGEVVHSFDVRTDGTLHNLKVVSSNHPCFEPHSTAAMKKALAEPQAEPREGRIIIKFMYIDDSPEEIEESLHALIK